MSHRQMHKHKHKHTEYRERLLEVFHEFELKTFEREELIRLIVLAIFCRQHIFLFGLPGVGKTYIARLASNIFGDNNYWEILMAHDTNTEQLMGSLKKDENGKTFRDISDSMLDKPFVFLDEMFKGSNRVLNALLGPMLDRKYIEGKNIFEVPLITLFGASNEFPEGEDIKPFEDRLMFRYDVLRIQKHENKVKYNNGEFDQTSFFKTHFSIDEIYDVESSIKKVIFSRHMLDNYIFLQNAIIKDGIAISDRKFGPNQAGKVFRTSAVLNGRNEVNYSDLMLLAHIAWHNLVDKVKLNEVMSNVLFGKEVDKEKKISDLEEIFTRTRGFFESECLDTMEYAKEYAGNFAGEMFKRDVDHIALYYEEFKKIQKLVLQINNKKLEVFHILHQCKENIFLHNIKQSVFTDERIERIEYVKNEIEKVLRYIEEWFNENQGVFHYNNKRAEKIHLAKINKQKR